MAVSREIVRERMQTFKEACAARGLKLTHQRIEIYRTLASTDEHPDAEAIYRRVRTRIPSISRDTVYRNLRHLAEQGLAAVVGMSHERLRFDANMNHHHHFVCTRCGLIRDFYSDRLGNMDFPKEAKEFGEAVSLHIEVKGICDKCKGLAKEN